jgi:SAM-dependent methyltransferase
MAHREQMQFVATVRAHFPDAFNGARVLEVGSLDINGSVRRFFEGGSYLGLDVAEGAGVDVVCQGQDYAAPDGSFDCVISCEVMEHNPHWRATFANMARLCRPGGLVVMTCASRGRPEHGTARTDPRSSPLTVGKGWSYYRNLVAADFTNALPMAELFSEWRFFRHFGSKDLYFVGFRSGGPAPAAAALRWIGLVCVWRNLASWRAIRHGLLLAVLGERRFLERRGHLAPMAGA